jgi:hypothetical protein
MKPVITIGSSETRTTYNGYLLLQMLFTVVVTPLFSIFTRKCIQEWLFGTDSTGYPACTDYGRINGETSLQWLQFFAEQCRQAATRKV